MAFVPGSAAYVDGRGGSSMRLNFSGANVNEIVEGVRRIGKVVDEQMALFSTFVKEKGGDRKSGSRRDEVPETTPPAEPMADVVELPRRRDERRAQGS